MRILVISQYYWPERFIINQLLAQLASQGHHIVVLTGKPNYPDGKIYSDYCQSGIQRQLHEGVEIIRVPMRPRKTGLGRHLFINYLSFMISGLLRFPKLIKGRKFDVIFVFAPSPIISAIPAILLKYLKKIHLAIWIQDLWPESLAATGFVKNKFFLKTVSYLVRGIYACSDTLLIQSRAFLKPVGMLANKEKIRYFPNVAENIDDCVSQKHHNFLPAELINTLEENFCLVFAGNIGTAQSIETIISAAVNWKKRADIKFIFIGDGSMLKWAKQKARELKLNNIVFSGAFPMEAMPSIFSRAEVLLVSLKPNDIFSYTIPSKVQVYMSSGRPIIACINGEAARIINEAGAGLTCDAGDVIGLSGCIQEMVSMSNDERDRFGLAGREYFLKHFEIGRQCKNLVNILESRISEEKCE